MKPAIEIGSDAGPWEQLWLRSVAVALELSPVAAGESSRLWLSAGKAVTVRFESGRIALSGGHVWEGNWDIHPQLLATNERRRLAVIMASDISERVDHLLTEVRHDAAMGGEPLTVVAIGTLSKGIGCVDHALESPPADALTRTVGMSSAALISTNASSTLRQLARRSGVNTLGLAHGVDADHVFDVLSPMDVLEALSRPSPEPAAEAFAPELVSQLRGLIAS